MLSLVTNLSKVSQYEAYQLSDNNRLNPKTLALESVSVTNGSSVTGGFVGRIIASRSPLGICVYDMWSFSIEVARIVLDVLS